jgi:hypothetical protein
MKQQQERQVSSTTTVDGPRAPTSTTAASSFTTRRRSSNIPIQRAGSTTMNNKYDPEYHAEQALQAHLQQHYAMRTWDMYHRITQSRIHHTSNKKHSPAKAASIDHCLLLQSTNNGPTCSWSSSSPSLRPAAVQPSSSPEQPVMDSMLEQDMLFPLDD